MALRRSHPSEVTHTRKGHAKGGASGDGPLTLLEPAAQVTRTLRASLFARIAFVVIVATLTALIIWQRDAIWRNVGWGILIATFATLAVTGAVLSRPKTTLMRGHRWLAFLIFAMVLWGALAFINGLGLLADASLGGYFGRAIIGGSGGFLAALRLLGYTLVGVALWSPRQSLRTTGAALGNLERGGIWFAKKSWPVLKAASANFAKAIEGVVEKGRAKLPHPAQSAPPELPASDGVVEGTAKPVPALAAGASPAEEPSGDETLMTAKVEKPKKKKAEKAEAEDDSPIPLGKAGSDGWRIPASDILDQAVLAPTSTGDQEARARRIEEALLSYGIEGSVVEINPGPAVTQYGIEPGWVRKFKEIRLRDEEGKSATDDEGKPLTSKEEVSRVRVKVDAIANLDKDLAMALAVPSIRIEAPIPGKALVGIEVPNGIFEMVSIRAILESPTYLKARAKSKLAVALGKGSSGDPEVADLAKMPHVLVAGATGSGKSVCINAFLVSLLMNATPNEVRLLLIDPKRVEMTPYNSIPHLITPVIVEVDKVTIALKWALHEMEERYKKFASVGARNLEAYNKSKQVVTPLPFLVIAIDELADLMMVAPIDVEHSLTRLAQLGRATGIHLIVATQRPSVNVVTGLIKANFPTRMSFAVSSQVDSRTILDSVGAEKLLGKGDMLYLPQDAPKPKRIQGVYVSDREVERVVRAWNSQSGALPPHRIRLEDVDEHGRLIEHQPPSPPASVATTPTGEPPAPIAIPSVAREAAQRQAAARANPDGILPTRKPAAGAPAPEPMRPPSLGDEDDDLDPLMAQARLLASQNVRLSPSLLQRRLRVGYTKARRLLELLEEEGLVDTGEEATP